MLRPQLRVDVVVMRAGTVVFLLLRALGVETEQCLRDYELSSSDSLQAMMQVKMDKLRARSTSSPQR